MPKRLQRYELFEKGTSCEGVLNKRLKPMGG